MADIFKFTFEEGRYTSGDNDYQVPDQIDLPPLAYMCDFSDRASEIVRGNSSEFMEEFQESISHESSVKAGFLSDAFSFGTQNSYKTVHSSAMQSSFQAMQEGKTHQMVSSAIATLYTYALRDGVE